MEKQENNYAVNKEVAPSRPSFREAFRRAAEQTDLALCDPKHADQYRELCYIIAEVYALREESSIKIGGEILDAYLVQEVFGELRAHHLESVYLNFARVEYPVKNKRAYLRTALYNAVFETEAGYANFAACLFGEK